MPEHNILTGHELHLPFHYILPSDQLPDSPSAGEYLASKIGGGDVVLIYRRNDANTAWVNTNPSFGEYIAVGLSQLVGAVNIVSDNFGSNTFLFLGLKESGGIGLVAGAFDIQISVKERHKFGAIATGSAQAIPTGVFTKVNFGNELFDTGARFAADTFTCGTQAGHGLFTATINANNPTTGMRFIASFFKNGAETHRFLDDRAQAGGTSINMAATGTRIIAVAATDTIDVRVLHDKGSDLALEAGMFTAFEGTMLF